MIGFKRNDRVQITRGGDVLYGLVGTVMLVYSQDHILVRLDSASYTGPFTFESCELRKLDVIECLGELVGD